MGPWEVFSSCLQPYLKEHQSSTNKCIRLVYWRYVTFLFFPAFVIEAFVVFWEPRSIWYGTAPPTPAASSADHPTECHFAPKETTQMDPATCGSIVLSKQETRLGMVGQAGREVGWHLQNTLGRGEFNVVPHLGRTSCLLSWREMLVTASRLGA